MKFGHDFEQTLGKGEFPQEWIDSAISYKQLKKCIKRVQRELQNLGLDTRALDLLWQGQDGDNDSGNQRITPKMVMTIDPITGSPQDAWLTEETRQALKRFTAPTQQTPAVDASPDLLALAEKDDLPSEPSEPSETSSGPPPDSPASSEDEGDDAGEKIRPMERKTSVSLEEIEMPLITNSEFFHVLKTEVNRLDDLQMAEQRKVEADISSLGQELTSMVEAGTKKSRGDIQAWREIFRIYVESEIFFSAREKDHGTRNSEKATKQLELFNTKVKDGHYAGKLTREGRVAFDRFIQINGSLLQYLRFQELNQTALRKIMKKFDKRTALHAQAIIPKQFAEKPFVAQSLARSVCFRISENLLTIIPQLNDYMCPVCFGLSYKPIRLRCEHVFCIRCLIVMQRASQDHCPLCRSGGVMTASSDNLDHQLMDFLKTNFPREVKLKQKENEYAAGVDRYGDDFEKAKCGVM